MPIIFGDQSRFNSNTLAPKEYVGQPLLCSNIQVDAYYLLFFWDYGYNFLVNFL